jgi:hypothetical protein
MYGVLGALPDVSRHIFFGRGYFPTSEFSVPESVCRANASGPFCGKVTMSGHLPINPLHGRFRLSINLSNRSNPRQG